VGRNRYTEIVATLAGELAGSPVGSRAAARAAVQELESRLLVRRVWGSGTFVNHRIDYVISPRKAPSWHQTVLDAGAVPRSVVLDIRSGTLTGDLAARLERSAGSRARVLTRQYYYINDLLATWTTEWIPDDVFPDAAEVAVRAVESVDLVLRQMAQVEPVRAWCRVSMDLMPPEVAAGLDLDEGRQAWLVESVSRDARRGYPVMASIAWTRPEMVRMVVEMNES
jgi:DNA-binding GntR family transcriptional regulator